MKKVKAELPFVLGQVLALLWELERVSSDTGDLDIRSNHEPATHLFKMSQPPTSTAKKSSLKEQRVHQGKDSSLFPPQPWDTPQPPRLGHTYCQSPSFLSP